MFSNASVNGERPANPTPGRRRPSSILLAIFVVLCALALIGYAVAAVFEQRQIDKCCTGGRGSKHAARVFLTCHAKAAKQDRDKCMSANAAAHYLLYIAVATGLAALVALFFRLSRRLFILVAFSLGFLIVTTIIGVALMWITGRSSCFEDWVIGDFLPRGHLCSDAWRVSRVYAEGFEAVFTVQNSLTHATVAFFSISAGIPLIAFLSAIYYLVHICRASNPPPPYRLLSTTAYPPSTVVPLTGAASHSPTPSHTPPTAVTRFGAPQTPHQFGDAISNASDTSDDDTPTPYTTTVPDSSSHGHAPDRTFVDRIRSFFGAAPKSS